MELQLRLPGDWPVGQHRRSLPDLDADDLASVLTRKCPEVACQLTKAMLMTTPSSC